MFKKIIFLFISSLLLASCSKTNFNNYSYGVFIGEDSNENLDYMKQYKKIVIDAQYLSEDDIHYLKDNNNEVYSYINIGSIEDFRPYYEAFKDLYLGKYENWEEEVWIDASNPNWQSFILNDLAPSLLSKGIDGFFVDNVDVYYNYSTPEIYSGVETILKGLKELNTYISINGGDSFVREYYFNNGNLDLIMDALNQETVFTKINFKFKTFSQANKYDREYYQEYISLVNKCEKDVYLLEYTRRESIAKKIKQYCDDNNFYYYISPSLELTI